MAFNFNKLKHAFGFNENGDDLDDELDYDMSSAPYVNPFHRDQKTEANSTQQSEAEQPEPNNPPAQQPEPRSEELSDAEHRVQVAQHRANMLAQRVADMENHMHKQETELTQALEDARATHQREIKAMQEALNKAKIEAARIEQVEKDWQQKLDTQRSETQAIRERYEQLIHERNTLENELDTRVKRAIADVQKDNNKNAAEVERLNKLIEEREEQYCANEQKSKDQITDLNNRINDLKRQMATAASLADDYREEMSALRKATTAATDKHEDLLNEIQEYKQLLHESQAAEMTAMDEQERLKKETDSALRARNNAQAKLEALQRDQDSITNKLKDEYEKQITALSTRAEQAAEEVERLKSLVVNSEEKLAQTATRLLAFEKTDQEKTSLLKKLEEELEQYKKQIETLSKESKSNNEIASQHIDAVRQLDSTRHELEVQRKLNVAAQSEIQQLSNDLAIAQAEVARLNHHLNEKAETSNIDVPTETITPTQEKPIIEFDTEPELEQLPQEPLFAESSEDSEFSEDSEQEIQPESEIVIEPEIEEPEPIIELEQEQEPESKQEQLFSDIPENSETPQVLEQEIEPQPEPIIEPEPVIEPEPEIEPEQELIVEPEQEPQKEEVLERQPTLHSPTLADLDDIDWLMPAEPDIEFEPETQSDPEPRVEPEPEIQLEPEPEPLAPEGARQLSLF